MKIINPGKRLADGEGQTPMLAYNGKWTMADIRWPVAVTPKFDGIRCLIKNGIAWTRSGKRIQNKEACRMLRECNGLEGSDGELMLTGNKTFHETQSYLMSRDTKLEDGVTLMYLIFDNFLQPQLGYIDRINRYFHLVQCSSAPNELVLSKVSPILVANETEFNKLAKENTKQEGLIVRSMDGPYKHGRSTLKEGYMLKYFLTKQVECIIRRVNPMMENRNPDTKEKHNLTAIQLVGSFTVTCEEFGSFSVGSGLTLKQQRHYWKEKPYGKTIIVEYKPYGTKDKPRQPIIKEIRE